MTKYLTWHLFGYNTILTYHSISYSQWLLNLFPSFVSHFGLMEFEF